MKSITKGLKMDNQHQRKNKSWRQHQIIDLTGCPKNKISDPANIIDWIDALIQKIDMKPYGDCQLEKFAEHDPDAAGYTLVQLIETSSITAHFAENLG